MFKVDEYAKKRAQNNNRTRFDVAGYAKERREKRTDPGNYYAKRIISSTVKGDEDYNALRQTDWDSAITRYAQQTGEDLSGSSAQIKSAINKNLKSYSPINNKWITAENKNLFDDYESAYDKGIRGEELTKIYDAAMSRVQGAANEALYAEQSKKANQFLDDVYTNGFYDANSDEYRKQLMSSGAFSVQGADMVIDYARKNNSMPYVTEEQYNLGKTKYEQALDIVKRANESYKKTSDRSFERKANRAEKKAAEIYAQQILPYEHKNTPRREFDDMAATYTGDDIESRIKKLAFQMQYEQNRTPGDITADLEQAKAELEQVRKDYDSAAKDSTGLGGGDAAIRRMKYEPIIAQAEEKYEKYLSENARYSAQALSEDIDKDGSLSFDELYAYVTDKNNKVEPITAMAALLEKASAYSDAKEATKNADKAIELAKQLKNQATGATSQKDKAMLDEFINSFRDIKEDAPLKKYEGLENNEDFDEVVSRSEATFGEREAKYEKHLESIQPVIDAVNNGFTTPHGTVTVMSALRMGSNATLEGGKNEEIWLLVNGSEAAGDLYKVSSGTYDRNQYKTLPDEVRNKFNYLWEVQGENQAVDYLKTYFGSAQGKKNKVEGSLKLEQEYARAHPVVSSLESIGENFQSGFGIVDSIGSYITGTPIDIYSPSQYASQRADAIRGQVSSGIRAQYGDAAGTVYDVGMSFADSVVTTAASAALFGPLGVGSGLSAKAAQQLVSASTSLIMSSQTATRAVIDGKRKGYSDDKALGLGIARGAAEALTEYFSIEKIQKATGSFWRKAAKSFVAEGTEEVSSNWLNRAIDLIACQDESEILKLRNAKNADEVFEVLLGMLGDDALSFVAGGLSGTAMSGVVNASRYAGYSSAGSEISAEELKNLQDYALAGDKKDLAPLAKVKSDYSKGQLYYAVQGDIYTKIDAAESISELNDIYDSVLKSGNATVDSIAQHIYENKLSKFGNSAIGQYILDNKQQNGIILLGTQSTDEKIRSIAQKAAENKSAENIGRLYSAMNSAMDIRTVIENMVKDEVLQKKVSEAEAEKISAVVSKSVLGQKLTKAERSLAQREDVAEMIQRTKNRDVMENIITHNVANAAVQDRSLRDPGVIVNGKSTSLTGYAGADAVVTAGGQTVPLSNVQFQSQTDAQLYNAGKVYADNNFAAQTFLHSYSQYSRHRSGEVSVDEYARAFGHYYNNGTVRTPFDTLEKTIGYDDISENAARSAYEAGRGKSVEQFKTPGAYYMFESTEEQKKFLSKNRIAIKALKEIAAELGISFVFTDRYVPGLRGQFDSDDNVIFISAKANGGIVTIAAGHELFHFIEKYDRNGAAALRKTIIDRLKKDGKYETVYNQVSAAYKPGTDIDSEIAADAMFDVLNNSRDLFEIVDRGGVKEGFWDKMHSELTRFVKAARRAVMGMKDAGTASLREDIDFLDSIREQFKTALNRAAENKRRGATGESVGQKFSSVLDGYDGRQLENWENSSRIIIYVDDEQLSSFIQNSLNQKSYNKKMYFGKVGQSLANKIFKNTGIDVYGYNLSVSSDEVRKIFKSHGSNKTENLRGQRAITENDFNALASVISEADRISLADALYNGKPIIRFEKNINGFITVVTIVSDKANDLRVQTMYASNKKRSIATAVSAADMNSAPSSYTSETTRGTASDNRTQLNQSATSNETSGSRLELNSVINNSIPQDGLKSQETAKYSRIYDEQKGVKSSQESEEQSIDIAGKHLYNDNESEGVNDGRKENRAGLSVRAGGYEDNRVYAQAQSQTGDNATVQEQFGRAGIHKELSAKRAELVRRENYRRSGVLPQLLDADITETLMQSGKTYVSLSKTNKNVFYNAIGTAKKGNAYGAFVEQHSVTEYENMLLLIGDNNNVGAAVTKDGNIVSVFKNSQNSKARGAVSSILLSAMANGGIKLDNFNSIDLSKMYEQHGFIPVARTAFVDEFAPDDWNYGRDGRPDIVFWVHNGDTVQQVAEKIGTYEIADISKVPMFGSYDEAEAYRDSILDDVLGKGDSGAKYSLAYGVDKKRKSSYNEFNTYAMQWANATTTQQGSEKTIYNPKTDEWCVIVADRNMDGGFGVVAYFNTYEDAVNWRKEVQVNVESYGREGSENSYSHADREGYFGLSDRWDSGDDGYGRIAEDEDVVDGNAGGDGGRDRTARNRYRTGQDIKESREIVKYYSREQARQFIEENNLKGLFDYIEKDTKLVRERMADGRFIDKLAKEIISESKSSYNLGLLKQQLQTLYDDLLNEKLTKDEFLADVVTVLRAAYEQAGTFRAEYVEGEEFLKKYRGETFAIQNIADTGYETFSDLNAAFGGTVRFVQAGGTSQHADNLLDKNWGFLVDDSGGALDSHANEGDQVKALKEFIETVQGARYIDFSEHIDSDIEKYSEWRAADLISKFAGVPEAKTYAQRVADKYKKQIEYMRHAFAAEKKQKVADVKKHYRDMQERNNLRKNMDSAVSSMRRRYDKPQKSGYVLEEYRDAFGAVLELAGTHVYRDIDMVKLKHMVKSVRTNIGDLEDLGGHVAEWSKYASDVLKELMAHVDPDSADFAYEDKFKDGNYTGRGTTVGAVLSMEDLDALSKVIQGLKHAEANAQKLLVNGRVQGVADISTGIADALKSTRKERLLANRASIPSGMGGYMNISLITPVYFFDSLGENGRALFKDLSDAQMNVYMDVNKGKQFFDNLIKDVDKKQFYATRDFMLQNGKKVTLTVQQLMTLYLMNKRQAAKGRIRELVVEKSGHGNGKVLEQNISVSESDLEAFSEALTEQQRAIAEKIRRFFVDVGAKWGNEASMRMYGFEMFTDNTYIPLITDPREHKSNGNEENKDMGFYAVANYGFTKQVNTESLPTFRIRNLFDVFADHTMKMAMYHNMAPVLNELAAIYNYNKDGINMKAVLENYLPGTDKNNGRMYLEKLIKDLNNVNTYDGSDELSIFHRLAGAGKKSMVALNLWVAAKQFTSYTRALNVLSAEALAKGFTLHPLQALEEAKKYNGLAVRKSEYGGYTTGTSPAIRDTMLSSAMVGREKTAHVAENALGFFAEQADNITWGALWNACKAQVQMDNEGIDIKSEEFFALVSDTFSEVINRTQVIDTPLNRSQIRRSRNPVTQTLTMFADESILTYNIARNAFAGKNTKRTRVWAAATFILSHVITQAIVSMIDAFRTTLRDEEKEEAFGGFADNLWKAGLQNLGVITNLPIFSAIVDLFSGYDTQLQEFEALNQLAQSARVWIGIVAEAIDEDGEAPDIEKGMRSLANTLARLSGIPFATWYKDIIATIDTVRIGCGELPLFEELSAKRISNALEKGYMTKAKQYTADLVKQKMKDDPDRTEKQVKADIRSSLNSKFKNKYLNAYKKNDRTQMKKIQEQLMRLNVGYTEELFSGWIEAYEKEQKDKKQGR